MREVYVLCKQVGDDTYIKGVFSNIDDAKAVAGYETWEDGKRYREDTFVHAWWQAGENGEWHIEEHGIS